jgi:hypothetical protein
MLKRIEGVCGEYICTNPECPEKRAQAETYANYRMALAKKQEGEIAKQQL